MSHRILISADWSAAKAWLLDRVAERVVESPLSCVRVVVPADTLASHLEERLLASGAEGFFGRVFTTLSGLMDELHQAAPQGGRPTPMPKALRLWGLSRLVRREVPEAGPMGAVRDTPGFVAAVDDLIQELREAGIDPGALAAFGEDRASDKVLELGRIYAGYRRMLEEHGWADAALEMQSGGKTIRESAAVQAFDPLFLFGFDDFTPVRFEVIRALVERHPGVSFVLPFDPERKEAFPTLDRTVRRLRELTGACPTSLPDFPAGDRALYHIGRQVFALRPPGVTPDASVQMLTASGPAQMVEAVARELRCLRHGDPSLRWGDCTVVFRSLSPYRRLVREVFPRFGIPFDLPGGTPWGEVPVLVTLRRLLGLKANGFAKEPLAACLRSTCCRVQIDSDALLRLAAMLPAHAAPETLSEQVQRLAEGLGQMAEEPSEDGPPPDLQDRIAGMRAKSGEMRAAFGRIAGLSDRARLSVYAEEIQGVADSLICSPEFSGEGDLPPEAETAARDRRALIEFDSTLRELDRVWPHDMSFEDFLALVDLLFREESLYEPRARTDAVAFHDALGVRGLSFRFVILAGLQEKEFPAVLPPGPFLREQEREALAAHADASLLSAADRAAKERLLFAWALQTARDRLYLACMDTDAEGRATVVSPSLEEVRGLCSDGGGPQRGIPVARACTMADVVPDRPEDLWYSEEAAVWALGRLYRGEGLASEGAAALWDLLHRREAGGLAAEITRWYDPDFTAFDGDLAGEASLAAHLRQAWTGRPLSPTRLDGYGRCPWGFFAGQMLGLESPIEEGVEIAPLDRGSLIHRILERFYRERWEHSSGHARPLGEEDGAEATTAIHRIAEEVCTAFEAQGRVGHPGAWAYEKQRLMRHLAWFVQSEIAYFKKHPELAPVHLEFSFGIGEHRGADAASVDDPLVLSGGGSEVRVRGIVDRIDAYPDGRAVVMDYKTGRSAPAPGDVRDGVSFQLFVYLEAAVRLLGLDPASGHYLMVAKAPGKRGSLSQIGEIRCGNKPARKGQLAWPDLRERVLRFLSAYSADICAGHFPVLPVSADPQGKACRYCGLRPACRMDEARLVQGKRESARQYARTRRMQEVDDVR